jgi:hypothetical protein
MRSAVALSKNVIARTLLAVVFLLAQQTASLHWLSHAIDATHAKASATTTLLPDHCDECLTLGALGAAAPSQRAALPVGFALHALLAARAAAPSPAALQLAFRSRAPPIPS